MANPRRRRGGGGGGSGDRGENGQDCNGNIQNGGPSHNASKSERRRGPRGGHYSASSSSWWGRCFSWIRLVTILSLICGTILAVYLYPFFSGDEYEEELSIIDDSDSDFDFLYDDDNKTASEVIGMMVQVSQDLLVFELQLRTFLEGERLAHLLKEQLQPVQDRVTSLTTQTNGYEKMDHISGGPTHFIATSLQELDSIEDNQLANLDLKVQSILGEEAVLAIGLGNSVMKLFDRSSFVLEACHHPSLIDEGIEIFPVDGDGDQIDDGAEEEEEKFKEYFAKYPLPQILPILLELAKKLRLKEDAVNKIEDIKNDLGIHEIDAYMEASTEELIMTHSIELGSAIDLLEWRSTEVEEFTEEHETELRLVLPLHTHLMTRVSTLQENLLNYATNKRRAYLDLRSTLQEDIRKLKVRIQNLRYKYAKISPS